MRIILLLITGTLLLSSCNTLHNLAFQMKYMERESKQQQVHVTKQRIVPNSPVNEPEEIIVASIAPASSPISESQIEPEVIKVTKRKIGNIVQPISNVSAKTDDGEPKTETMSLVGFILSAGGLLLSSISPVLLLCLVAGLVLCILGLLKINNDPDMYKGRGFAIAGIAIGALFLGTLLLFIRLLI